MMASSDEQAFEQRLVQRTAQKSQTRYQNTHESIGFSLINVAASNWRTLSFRFFSGGSEIWLSASITPSDTICTLELRTSKLSTERWKILLVHSSGKPNMSYAGLKTKICSYIRNSSIQNAIYRT